MIDSARTFALRIVSCSTICSDGGLQMEGTRETAREVAISRQLMRSRDDLKARGVKILRRLEEKSEGSGAQKHTGR